LERCPLCRSPRRRLLHASNLDASRSRAGRLSCTNAGLGIHPDIFACLECGMVFNEPAEGHLAEYEETADPEYLAQRESRRRTYARELDRLERHAPGRELLDVGCHSGFFLEQARERGYRVSGVEPSRWAVEHARGALGLEVFHGSVEDFEPARPFDVITMWDVIEHLTDPVRVLAKLHRLLRPGGLLAFTTHNLDSLAARALRGRYPFFMEMHTIHLRTRTRDRLLADTGLERVAVHAHLRAVRVDYLVSRLRRFGEAPARLASRAVRGLGVAERIVWIGGSGLETVIARRRAA
jgi:2-polyprenyl-3-methyl-5-hydroxy-6-metoxy-1,4-benzoquinol methylase